ncbi:uncharacterized protein Dvir_GJ26834, isoform A [Drosophila virilis]|uniref:Uncharacterized protein, isoform A n=1 Tax=Drosophila virilis TaxID=7244 RepID=A0A0Q9WNI7_DROVI|nr:uncharacterized protein Dvir_GJ26834, isoform A [Drosophila virilis]
MSKLIGLPILWVIIKIYIKKSTIPVTVAEIAEVSQMLMAALGNNVEDENTVALDQFEENDPLEDSESDYSEQRSESDFNISDDDIIEISNKKGKRPSRSSFGKTIRNRWSNEEREEIYQAFGDLLSLKGLPSLKQCNAVINNSTYLKCRTPAQVKTWIDNQRKAKSRKSTPQTD